MNREEFRNFCLELCSELTSGLEIFIEPYLNGIKPDLVVLHPEKGLNTIFVDYLNFPEGFQVLGENEDTTHIKSKTETTEIMHKIPFWKLKLASLELNRLYGFRLRTRVIGQQINPPTMTFTLLYPNIKFSSQDRIKINKFLKNIDGYLLDKSDIVDLSAKSSNFFPQSYYESFPVIEPKAIADLRNWLKQPDSKRAVQIKFTNNQMRIVSNPDNIKRRRVRGGPGTGKTEALLARAANLFSQNKEVLYLTYNITILNELRSRFLSHVTNKNGFITWLNYHDWCKRLAHQFGFEKDWSSRFFRENDDKAFENVGEFIIIQLEHMAIPDEHKFDVIIVDEAQDMALDWIKAATLFLKSGGELLIAADTRQDIYDRSQNWTSVEMNGLGFNGPWLTLGKSHRTPAYLIPLINKFKKRFLDHSSLEEIEALDLSDEIGEQLSLGDKLDVIECSDTNLPKTAFEVIHKLITQDKAAERGNPNRSVEDIIILVSKKNIGADIGARLSELKVKIETTFPLKRQKGTLTERDMKLEFSSLSGKVKISTIHSFKGMGGSRVILVLDNNRNHSFKKLVYVGLSRLKAGALGHSLFIVSSNIELNSFLKNSL